MSTSHRKSNESNLESQSVLFKRSSVPRNEQTSLKTETIPRLFVKLALPMSIGMVINGLYNLVDSFFITSYTGHAGMGGVSIAISQVIGRARSAVLISAAKIYCFLIPLMVALTKMFGISFIWYAFPMADGLSLLLVVSLLIYFWKKNKKVSLPENAL